MKSFLTRAALIRVDLKSVALFGLLSLAVGACGGVQQSSELQLDGAPRLDSAFTHLDGAALDAILGTEPVDAEQSLLMSWIYDVAGDPEAALETLTGPGVWADDSLEYVRLLRIWDLRNRTSGFDAVVGDWLPSAEHSHPVLRLVHASLAELVAYREYRYAMLPGRFDGAEWGSAEEWRAVGPVTELPVLGMRRSWPPESMESLQEYDGGDTGGPHYVIPRAGGVSWANGGGGVSYAEAFVTASAPGEVIVGAGAADSWQLRIDDNVIMQRGVDEMWDEDRRLRRIHLSAGTHRILMKVGTDSTVATASVRVLPLNGQALRFGLSPGDASGSIEHLGEALGFADVARGYEGEVGWLAAAEIALFADDDLGIAALVGEAPESAHPVTAWMLARLLVAANQLPSSESATLRLDAIRAGIDAWPGAFGLQQYYANSLDAAGQHDEARAVVEMIVEQDPGNFAALTTLADYYAAEGWSVRARHVTEDAHRVFPRNCPIIERLIEYRLDDGEALTPESLPAEWLLCDGTYGHLLENYYRPRGELAASLATAELLASRNPTSDFYAELLLDAAVAAGDQDAVAAALASAERYAWDPSDADAQRAGLLLADGDAAGATTLLRESVRQNPQAMYLSRRLAQIENSRVLHDMRVDGLEAVAAYQASGASYESDVVYVRDAGTWRFFEDGASINVIHQIIELRSRDSLANYGEVGVPNGALLLNVRTIKADGRALVPELIAGKDSISMPSLEVGDCIELEYAQSYWPPAGDRKTANTERFYFQVPEAPLHESSLTISYPAEWHDVVFDERNIETGRESRDGEVVTRHWVRTGSVPPAPQSQAPAPDEWLPSVAFSYDYTWADAVDYFTGYIAQKVVPTPEIEALARQLAGDRSSRTERARSIFRYVVDEIVAGGGFFGTPAAWAVASGEGDRLALAVALFEAAGMEPEVVFIRPHDGDSTEPVIPSTGLFDFTAIVLRNGTEIWLDPTVDDQPFNYLPPEIQGASGLVITGPRRGEFITTPTWPEALEVATIDLDVDLAADGSAIVRVRESVPLRSAPGFRQYLKYAQSEREVLQDIEGSIASSFSGAEVLRFEAANEGALDEPLQLEYAFAVPHFANPSADGLVFEGAVFERDLLGAYGSMPERERDLLISRPLRETLRMTIRAADDMRAVELPTSHERSWGQLSASRSATRSEEGVVVEREILLPIGRVSPEDYAEFRGVLADIRADQQLRIVFAAQ